MPPDKELIGATTALVVLASLNVSPSYGYELLKRINIEADGLFAWQEGTLYPLLHRLENEGFVRPQWQDADAGGARRRKYYYITTKGRRHLEAATSQWHAFHALINRITNSSKPALD